MKKKFLSLMMAAAVVATTSVSAFADTNEQVYDITSETKDHKVEITGNVTDSENNKVPGTISVTVPTAISFTVDKNGEIAAAEIKIKNTSDNKVEVIAKEFTDTTTATGIVIVKDKELDNKIAENDATKRHISLTLTGNKALGLISGKTDNKTGFIDEEGNEIASTGDTSLGYAWKDSDLNLRLTGRAKKNDSTPYEAPTTAMQDTFNLVLKIQKADKTK